ncbi:uncharacterized protein LOC136085562 [Hydra vulgaris]|uniref:Uncharacterized protein LOC136085562 n=1 Tax=Hydra vulgaris TaxID=6087 RepID=A0ABM4CMB1_HYDVU
MNGVLNLQDVKEEKKRMDGEMSRDVGLTAKEEMERVIKGTVDRLFNELKTRSVRLMEIDEKFGFLLDMEELCFNTEIKYLKDQCKKFGKVYSSDVDGRELYEEILDCRMLLTSCKEKVSSPEQLLMFIVEYGDENVFPNMRIALQILLTIAVSVASCERTFSKIRLINSYLRTSMDQSRLCDLALLSLKRENTEEINFDNVIKKFAAIKARKINL